MKSINTLNTLHIENNFITEETADSEDLTTAIINNPSLEKLYLGYNRLRLKCSLKLCCSLKKISQLKELSLSDISISEEAANEIGKVTFNNDNLEKLWLNNNNLRDVGVIKVSLQLKQLSNLRLLRLDYNYISEEAAESIARVINSNLFLESIFIGNNNFRSKGVIRVAKALRGLLHLKQIGLNNNGITEDAASDIAEAVNNNNKLENLWLNNNDLKLTGINMITNTFQHLNTLKLLDLSNNGITAQATDGIAAVINNNPSLQTVALGNNKLETGVIKIANALKNIKDLRVLGLDNNCITDKAANAIANVIYSNVELEKLLLNDNNLQSSGIKVICKNLTHIKSLKVLLLQHNCITEEAADDLAAVIINNPLLENFDVSNNKIGSVGIRKIAEVLKTLCYLKVLSINNIQLTDDATKDIAQIITNNLVLEKVFLINNSLKLSISKITDSLYQLIF